MAAHGFDWDRWIIPVVIALVMVMGFAFVGLKINHMEQIIEGIETRARQRIEAVEQRLSGAIQRMDAMQSRGTDTRITMPSTKQGTSGSIGDLKTPSPVDATTGTATLLAPAPLSSQKIFSK
jgi:hypothetical protein